MRAEAMCSWDMRHANDQQASTMWMKTILQKMAEDKTERPGSQDDPEEQSHLPSWRASPFWDNHAKKELYFYLV